MRWFLKTVTALAAFGAIIVVIEALVVHREDPLPWLAACAGLGGIAFGAQQATRLLIESDARRRKVRGVARLVRRSMDENLRLADGRTLRSWVESVGNARTLDAVEELAREMLFLSAEVGGREAAAGEAAFKHFLAMADHVNKMGTRVTSLDEMTNAEDREAKGAALTALIAAIESLEELAAREEHEKIPLDKMRQHAAALRRFSLPSRDAPA